MDGGSGTGHEDAPATAAEPHLLFGGGASQTGPLPLGGPQAQVGSGGGSRRKLQSVCNGGNRRDYGLMAWANCVSYWFVEPNPRVHRCRSCVVMCAACPRHPLRSSVWKVGEPWQLAEGVAAGSSLLVLWGTDILRGPVCKPPLHECI